MKIQSMNGRNSQKRRRKEKKQKQNETIQITRTHKTHNENERSDDIEMDEELWARIIDCIASRSMQLREAMCDGATLLSKLQNLEEHSGPDRQNCSKAFL